MICPNCKHQPLHTDSYFDIDAEDVLRLFRFLYVSMFPEREQVAAQRVVDFIAEQHAEVPA